MTDEIFWEAHEELKEKLGREPDYEEVLDYLSGNFKGKEVNKKYHQYSFRYYFSRLSLAIFNTLLTLAFP